ncbi:hypothetical protein ACIP4S_17420 [Streptomyces chartreusis]|uniref:WD40 repeat domain-containing protein n=1 Tax=Streptomyces chartreusis TaxID=1969 RepID=UPI00382A8707
MDERQSGQHDENAYDKALEAQGRALRELRADRGEKSYRLIDERALDLFDKSLPKATLSDAFRGRHIGIDRLMLLVRTLMSWDQYGQECPAPRHTSEALEPWRSNGKRLIALRPRRARPEPARQAREPLPPVEPPQLDHESIPASEIEPEIEPVPGSAPPPVSTERLFIVQPRETAEDPYHDAPVGDVRYVPMGMPFATHARVCSVAFSPVSGLIAVGGNSGLSGSVRLWDSARLLPVGEPLPAPGSYTSVLSLAFSPDGCLLAVGDDKRSVHQWDPATRTLVGEPLIHASRVCCMAFSPDGRHLLTGGADGTMRQWAAATREPVGEAFDAHNDAVSSIEFNPGGRLLATGGDDGIVRLWDASTFAMVGEPFVGREGTVSSVAFSPDGRLLAVGGSDHTVWLWDVATGETVGEPLEHKSPVFSVAFSPHGHLAVGVDDGTVRLWDPGTLTPIGDPLIADYSADDAAVVSVTFSADGRRLAAGSKNGRVRLWRRATGSRPARPAAAAPSSLAARMVVGAMHRGAAASIGLLDDTYFLVRAVAFAPDGALFATGGAEGVLLWDLATRRPIADPMTGHSGTVSSLAFSPDGQLLASGAGGMVQLWDARTRTPVGDPIPHKGTVHALAFSPDGALLASGDRHGVRLTDQATHTPIGERLSHYDAVNSVAFSPDGRLLAMGGPGAVRLWDAATRPASSELLTRNGDGTYWVAFSPDGGLLATGGPDALRLWDPHSGKPVGDPLPRTGPVFAVAFSPDGRLLAVAGGDDGFVQLWDRDTLAPVGEPLTGGNGPVFAVAFSPDSSVLAVSGERGTVFWT